MQQLSLAIDYVNFTFRLLNVMMSDFEYPNCSYVKVRVKKKPLCLQ